MITVRPQRSIKASITVPGSKSLTQRALVTSALADGESIIRGALISEDTNFLIEALRSLGTEITVEAEDVVINGTGGLIKIPKKPLYMGNNGTGIRFLTAVSALGGGRVVLTGSQRMEQRPIQDLLDVLNKLGAETISINGTGCPPVKVMSPSGTLPGGPVTIAGSSSSQFISAILLVAPYARRRVILEIEGEMVSTPYVFMTLKVMNDFGISVLCKDYRIFDVPQGRYISRVYTVEGDASNASYFWAAAAVTGGRVCVENVFADTIQGDAAFLNILEKMGCRVEKGDDGITVFGPERLQGVTVDMNKWPDIVPTLAVVAAQAETETVIKNVAHLRIKETDRIRAVATELRKIGAQVEELPDGLVIRKGGPCGGVIETYNDHRIAMSFAVAGLVTPDISIAGEECVAKSFPNFWETFDHLYA